jgi:hypothetical protein
VFKQDPKDYDLRKALYLSWPPEQRRQAWYQVSPNVRNMMDMWDATEDQPSQPPAPMQDPVATSSNQGAEEVSHNWKEGERIGEAKNPGPKGRNRSGTVRPG